MDRELALQDSDFVFLSALLDCHYASEAEREVAMKHGYPFSGGPRLGTYHQLDCSRRLYELSRIFVQMRG
jgi:hypothetical protein